MTDNRQLKNVNSDPALNVGSEQNLDAIVINMNNSKENNQNQPQQNESPAIPANNPPLENNQNQNIIPDSELKKEYFESMKMKNMILGKHFHTETNVKVRIYKKPKNCKACCKECGWCFLYGMGYIWICVYDLFVYVIPLTLRCALETVYMFCFICTAFYKTPLLADHNRYYQFQHPYRVSITGALMKRGCNVCMSTFKICCLRWGCCFCVLYDHFRRLYKSSRRESYKKLYGDEQEHISVEIEHGQEEQIIQIRSNTQANLNNQNIQANENNNQIK